VSRRLLGSFLTLTVLVLLVLELPLGLTFANHERDRLTTEIERDAVVLSTFVEDALQEGAPLDEGPLRRYVEQTGARVVVVDGDGIAVLDTDATRAGRSFATRPEIIRALSGRVATGTRRSDTLGTDLLYVAVPVASSGHVFGVVRVTYPTAEIDRRVGRYWWTLGAVALVSVLAATLLGLVLARSVSTPMRRLGRVAAALGDGDLTARVGAVGGPPVVRSVAAVFDDMADRLDDLVAAQDAFVADASHQLRNPLTALRLRLENLHRDVGPDGVEDLTGALDEVARLSRMVDGLLVLARSGAGDAPRPTAPIDVAAVVEECRAAWTPLADEREVRIRTEIGDERRGLATEDRLRQVVDNLLANALDAAPPGSEIVLRVAADDGGLAVHVEDAGPGRSDDERRHAFDRFWRAASATSAQLGGSGLGLAIVKKLVVADGGDVRLQASAAGGVDAVVRFRGAAGG
jgi:signal transduction histidine kinase